MHKLWKAHVLVQTKSTSGVHINQNTYACTPFLKANHDAHGSKLKSHAYTHTLNTHFHNIDLMHKQPMWLYPGVEEAILHWSGRISGHF